MGMNKTKIDYADLRKGTSRINAGQYILIYAPKHPHAKGKGHILEHRYIMEKHLQRFLNTDEHIHHKNGEGKDNRIENLKIISPSDHRKLHYKREDIINGIKALNKYAASIKLPRDKIKCACGCRNDLINRDQKGRKRKYIHGHNASGKHWKWKKNVA